MSPDDVFVWLEGLDISTRTDPEGFFQITLPPPSSQPGGSLSGVFKLYFYVANYRLDSAYVVILNGCVEYDHGDLNEKGEISRTKCLSEFLSIRTSLNPSTIDENYEGFIDVTVSVHTDTDTVVVEVPKMMGNLMTAAFIKGVDSDGDFVRVIDNGGNTRRFFYCGY